MTASYSKIRIADSLLNRLKVITMKRIFLSVLMLLSALSLFAGGSKEAAATAPLKLGMITDAATIDDRSYNEGAWEGVSRAGEEYGLEYYYIRPSGTGIADYVAAITELHDSGYQFIVCPGYLFSDAVEEAQSMYPELMLLSIDNRPEGEIGQNTLSIFFKEQEAGFLAGVATALQLRERAVGFIGGMEIPAVQRYSWGFQQGIRYANENYGTKITMSPSDFIYSDSFTDTALGQQLAASMYDRGVTVIFPCGGAIGNGVIDEAIRRRVNGTEVWVVGVDVDQYHLGEMGDGSSCVLTSAIKKLDVAIYTEAVNAIDGNFEGGRVLTVGVTEDAVGLPEENPNLSADVTAEIAKVTELMKSGVITVQETAEGLIP